MFSVFLRISSCLVSYVSFTLFIWFCDCLFSVRRVVLGGSRAMPAEDQKCTSKGIHPVRIARIHYPRFVPRVGSGFKEIRRLSALRISKGWVREDPNLGLRTGCRATGPVWNWTNCLLVYDSCAATWVLQTGVFGIVEMCLALTRKLVFRDHYARVFTSRSNIFQVTRKPLFSKPLLRPISLHTLWISEGLSQA